MSNAALPRLKHGFGFRVVSAAVVCGWCLLTVVARAQQSVWQVSLKRNAAHAVALNSVRLMPQAGAVQSAMLHSTRHSVSTQTPGYRRAARHVKARGVRGTSKPKQKHVHRVDGRALIFTIDANAHYGTREPNNTGITATTSLPKTDIEHSGWTAHTKPDASRGLKTVTHIL